MGLEVGLSNGQYHSMPGVSNSHIRQIRDDVVGYMRDGPTPLPDTDAKLLGSAAHSYILEPDTFKDEYATYPGKVRRGKKWEEFNEENADKHIITNKMLERCQGMRDSLAAAGYSWLWDGYDIIREGSLWAHEQNSGVLCKVRPDVYDETEACAVDLKTTSNPHWQRQGKYKKGFEYSVRKFGYYIQAPFYMDILMSGGVPCYNFEFLAVGSSPPHDVWSHELGSAFNRDGRGEYIKQLMRLRQAVIDYDGGDYGDE